jgi:hypothetical protein
MHESDEREEHQATDAENWRSDRGAVRSVAGIHGMLVSNGLQPTELLVFGI